MISCLTKLFLILVVYIAEFGGSIDASLLAGTMIYVSSSNLRRTMSKVVVLRSPALAGYAAGPEAKFSYFVLFTNETLELACLRALFACRALPFGSIHNIDRHLRSDVDRLSYNVVSPGEMRIGLQGEPK